MFLSKISSKQEKKQTIECYSVIKKNAICLPMEHQRAQQNSFKGVRAFQIEMEFGNVGV